MNNRFKRFKSCYNIDITQYYYPMVYYEHRLY